MRNTALTLLCLLACTALKAQRADEFPYQSGEKIEFTASFQAPMWPNTNMAKLTVEVSDEMLDEKIPTYRISAFARTTVARWVYKMDSRYITWLDMDGRPVKSSTNIKENNYVYSNDCWYDLDNGKIYMRYSKGDKKIDRRDTITVTRDAYDMVGLIYHIRSMDPDRMEIGVDQESELLGQKSVKTVKFRFLGRETKKIKGYGDVKTLHFSSEIAMRDGTEFESGNDLHVWLSDDRNRIPMLIESPIRWGRVKAVLTYYKNLKFPDDGILE